MKIVLSRVDERLVHGQVIASWTKILSIKKILIIDTQLAADDFMKTVISMAAPSGVSVSILTVDEAVELLRSEEDGSGVNTMLLFKNAVYALELVEKGVNLKELNIGNMGAASARKAISKNVYATPQEIEVFKKLMDKGVYVYLQMVQAESKVDLHTKL
jgi:PTS system mannose-specific IIB component